MRPLMKFVRAAACEQVLVSAAGAFVLVLMIGLGLWVLDLGDTAVGMLAILSDVLHAAYAFAGWTLFVFAPVGAVLLVLAAKRLSEGLELSDRRILGLIEVCAYGVGLLGTLHNLKQAAQVAELTFQSAMSAFNPLEIGIGLWIICQLVSWEFGSRRPQSNKQDDGQSELPVDTRGGSGVATEANASLETQLGAVEHAGTHAQDYDE